MIIIHKNGKILFVNDASLNTIGYKYDELIANMKKKNIKPDGMGYYLDVFKFAMPPHGGWGMGSERLIQQMLNLGSIKEAILFPRDVKRLSP